MYIINDNMKKIKRFFLVLILLALFILFMALYSPSNLNLGLLLVPFLLMGVIIYNLMILLMDIFRLARRSSERRQAFAVVCSVIVVNFVILQSIGRITLADVAIIIIITSIVVFYVTRLRGKRI